MKYKYKTLLASLSLILLASSLLVSSAYAFLKASNKEEIIVTSGGIDVSASISDIKGYSLIHALQKDGGIYYELGEEFDSIDPYFIEEEIEPIDNTVNYINGGFASVEQNKLVLDKLTPGDAFAFTIDLSNDSEIKTKYSVNIKPGEGSSLDLFQNLVFKVNNESINSQSNYSSSCNELDKKEDKSFRVYIGSLLLYPTSLEERLLL